MKTLQVLADDELVKLFVNGNHKCAEVLCSRHRPKIYGYLLLNLKQPDLAEDLLQDTFLKVIQSLKSNRYEQNGKFSSWVFRIAHNLLMDHFRSRRKLPLVAKDDFSGEIINQLKYCELPYESDWIKEQQLNALGGLVQHLPANQREVIRMKHFEGLSFKEIAEENGVSINTALGRMRYAVLNLRRMMQERRMLADF